MPEPKKYRRAPAFWGMLHVMIFGSRVLLDRWRTPGWSIRPSRPPPEHGKLSFSVKKLGGPISRPPFQREHEDEDERERELQREVQVPLPCAYTISVITITFVVTVTVVIRATYIIRSTMRGLPPYP